MMSDVTKVMADRLQRFIPDRANAEGMAEALQEDLRHAGLAIVPQEPTQAMVDAAARTPGMKWVNDIVITAQVRAGHDFMHGKTGEGTPLAQAYAAMVGVASNVLPSTGE